ncbi:MAG: RNA pyrophosphohydrolase [Alphaproteobacteria bacterium]|nr:RNA pyrophosphohydrolase [Alphaproteobacteria bacterium]
MSREPAPAEGAYRPAVGIMLLDPRDRIFVARRLDMKEEAWQMPQGGIDEGETPRRAALRELKEEIGTDKAAILAESRQWHHYDLPADLVGRLWGGRYRGQRQKWFAMRFTGTDADIDVATEHPEFGDWKWVPAAEVPRLIVPFKRRLYEEILAEFAPLLTKSR